MVPKATTLAASALALMMTANAVHASPLTLGEAVRIDPSSSMPGEPTLAEIRAATERFLDVDVALAEGYVRDPGNLCDTAEMMGKPRELGAMGIHFFRPDLLGITAPPNPRVDGNGTHTDFLRPSVLIYEPQAGGTLELVAVENLVFAKALKEAANDAPPTFHGVAYDTMVDDPATFVDEAHMFEPHYDRHVWLYRENPNGIFAQYNPAVSCAHHTANAHQAHEHGASAGAADHAHRHAHRE